MDFLIDKIKMVKQQTVHTVICIILKCRIGGQLYLKGIKE